MDKRHKMRESADQDAANIFLNLPSFLTYQLANFSTSDVFTSLQYD